MHLAGTEGRPAALPRGSYPGSRNSHLLDAGQAGLPSGGFCSSAGPDSDSCLRALMLGTGLATAALRGGARPSLGTAAVPPGGSISEPAHPASQPALPPLCTDPPPGAPPAGAWTPTWLLHKHFLPSIYKRLRELLTIPAYVFTLKNVCRLDRRELWTQMKN